MRVAMSMGVLALVCGLVGCNDQPNESAPPSAASAAPDKAVAKIPAENVAKVVISVPGMS